MGLYLCKTAYENPGVSVLYVALTKDSAERIMWKDVLKSIDKLFGLGMKFNDTKLTATFPNGAVLFLLGADSREDDMNKLLGQKFKLAVIDEASKYRIDIHRMIFDVLKPAMADYNGQIALIGTADNFVNSYFARITRGYEPGWAVHKWSAIHNPHMIKQFTKEINELKSKNPNVVNEAWFQQNYEGAWVVDTKALIYHYDQTNIADELPVDQGPWTYVLGVLLNSSGQSAYSVIAYSSKSPAAYIVRGYKRPYVDLYAVVEEAIKLHNIHNFSSIVCVDAGERLTSEIRKRFPISVESVSEKDKPALMQLFTSDLNHQKVKVLRKNADILLEWESVIMDDNAPKGAIRVHLLSQDQISSATLYAWMKCYNYTYKPAQLREDPIDDYWDKKIEELENNGTRDPDEYYGLA